MINFEKYKKELLDRGNAKMENLRFKSHEGHLDILKEFYSLNKYLITEQLKDTLLDAIECMEFTINVQKTNQKIDWSEVE